MFLRDIVPIDVKEIVLKKVLSQKHLGKKEGGKGFETIGDFIFVQNGGVYFVIGEHEKKSRTELDLRLLCRSRLQEAYPEMWGFFNVDAIVKQETVYQECVKSIFDKSPPLIGAIYQDGGMVLVYKLYESQLSSPSPHMDRKSVFYQYLKDSLKDEKPKQPLSNNSQSDLLEEVFYYDRSCYLVIKESEVRDIIPAAKAFYAAIYPLIPFEMREFFDAKRYLQADGETMGMESILGFQYPFISIKIEDKTRSGNPKAVASDTLDEDSWRICKLY